jgi:hypothetical protein
MTACPLPLVFHDAKGGSVAMQRFRVIARPIVVAAASVLVSTAAYSAAPTMPPVPDPTPKPKCAPPPITVLTDAERQARNGKPDADLIADAVRRTQAQFPELKCK